MKARVLGAILLILIFAAVFSLAFVFGKNNKNQSGPVTGIVSNTKFPEKQNLESSNTNNSTDSASAGRKPANLPPGVNVSTLNSTKVKDVNANVITVQNVDKFSIVVEAQLPKIAKGALYTVWLANTQNSNLVKIGNLEMTADKYVISSEQMGNASSYSKIVITKETKNDNNPEIEILTGSL